MVGGDDRVTKLLIGFSFAREMTLKSLGVKLVLEMKFVFVDCIRRSRVLMEARMISSSQKEGYRGSLISDRKKQASTSRRI